MRSENEHNEQVTFFKWAEHSISKYPMLEYMFAIPNGGVRGGSQLQRIINGKKLKNEGVKSGVPDIFLPYPTKGYHGLFIEMKVKPNKTSENQKKFINFLLRRNYLAIICYSHEEAIQATQKYLLEDNTILVELYLGENEKQPIC